VGRRRFSSSLSIIFSLDRGDETVAKQLYLVFSRRPAGVDEEEYERWYHDHVRENVEVPGFIVGERFAASLVMSGSRVAPGRFTSDSEAAGEDVLDFAHLAMYEHEGDLAELRRALFERIDRGETVLPDWFDEIRFMTWSLISIDDPVRPTHAGAADTADVTTY
jgi:hypothetical protein